MEFVKGYQNSCCLVITATLKLYIMLHHHKLNILHGRVILIPRIALAPFVMDNIEKNEKAL